jgi:hypothetical protein
VAGVVVSLPLRGPWQQRQDGVVRSDAWMLDFSSTHSTIAAPGGFRYCSTTSRTLSMNCGSVDSLKVSTRVGLEPERPPDPADRRLRHAGLAGLRSGRPVGRILGRRLQRHDQHPLDLLVADRAGRPRPRSSSARPSS